MVVNKAVMYVFQWTIFKATFYKSPQLAGSLVCLCDVFPTDFGDESVAFPEPGLEVLSATHALELSIHHNGDTRAQGLALLHAGRERDNHNHKLLFRLQRSVS